MRGCAVWVEEQAVHTHGVHIYTHACHIQTRMYVIHLELRSAGSSPVSGLLQGQASEDRKGRGRGSDLSHRTVGTIQLT